jgi:hypothetical protein
LLMIQMQSRLQEVFQRDIAIIDLFHFPTVRELARSSGRPQIIMSRKSPSIRRAPRPVANPSRGVCIAASNSRVPWPDQLDRRGTSCARFTGGTPAPLPCWQRRYCSSA